MERKVAELFIQAGAQHCDEDVREIGGTIIHLQPTDNAMLLEILRNAIFRDAQVFGEFRFEGFSAALGSAATDQIGNGHAQRLASLYVVVGRQIGVRQQPHAGACGSMAGILEFCGRAGE